MRASPMRASAKIHGVKHHLLRRVGFFGLAAGLAAGVVLAQSPATPPPKLEPLPELPAVAGDPELEPQVTIIRREDEVREEVRVGGELQYIRVTPRHGRPYFLVPDRGGQTFMRRDSLDPGLRVPMWTLFSW